MMCLLLGLSPPAVSLRSALERRVPTTGVMEVVFSGKSGREVRAGFDFGTGVWYRMDDNQVIGLQPDGTFFWGPAGLGRAETVPDPRRSQQVQVADFIPDIWGWSILNQPELVKAVREEDGRYIADLQLPDWSSPELHIHYDAQGVVRRVVRDGFPEHRGAEIIYSDKPGVGGRLPAELPAYSLTLASVQERSAAAPDTFDLKRIEGVSAQLQWNAAKARAEASATESATAGAGAQAGGNNRPRPAAPGSSLQWPLLATGITFVMGGIGFMVWKRRR